MLRYSISDRRLFAERQPIAPPAGLAPEAVLADPLLAGVLEQARRLADAGVDYFLLREPDLPTRDLADLARGVAGHFRATGARTQLLLHSRTDIAVATRAHGVHLPSSPGRLLPSDIREIYRLTGLPNPTVSLSCHSLDDVRRALACGQAPDLFLFGPVFEKRVRGEIIQHGTGLILLRHACEVAGTVPVLALGGVTDANTSECLRAGAAGVAAIRLFL